MGQQHHVRHRAQRRRHVRLVVEHVESRAQDRAGLKRRDQRVLIHDAAARDVDDDALRAKRRQHIRVDDV